MESSQKTSYVNVKYNFDKKYHFDNEFLVTPNRMTALQVNSPEARKLLLRAFTRAEDDDWDYVIRSRFWYKGLLERLEQELYSGDHQLYMDTGSNLDYYNLMVNDIIKRLKPEETTWQKIKKRLRVLTK